MSPIDAVDISELRWMNTIKGWGWLACVHFQDQGHRRTYVFVINENEIVDARYAVETDACNAQTYSPLNLASGPTPRPLSGDTGPLY